MFKSFLRFSHRELVRSSKPQRSAKHQAPSSREIPSSKFQNYFKDTAQGFHKQGLELGIWSFSGAWSLVFGACSVAILAAALFLSSALAPCAHGSFSSLAPESKAVKVTTERANGVTHFYVENKELCEVTMTFEMALTHLRGSTQFPYTATFPAGKVTEAFTLTSDGPEAKWEYSYTNYYKLGSNCTQHDDSYSYELPYGAGSTFRVTQAY